MGKIQEFDQKIIEALKNLKTPMKSANGIDIYFDIRKRKETTFEHIANKKHSLKVRDIELIPLIFKDKSSIFKDKKSRKFRTYYGKRIGNKLKNPYLKIITKISSNKVEMIITVYSVRKKG